MVEPILQNDAQALVAPNQDQLPAQGAPPGVPMPSILAGVPTTGVGAAPDLAAAVLQNFLQQTTQIASNSTVAQKAKTAALQKAAIAATPVQDNPQPAPGSFADKLAGAYDSVSGALSDAAHAHDTRGGWLSGVVNTLNARQARLAQDRKDAVLLAKSQAETIAMHRNFYQQDTAHRQEFYNNNQKFIDRYKAAHNVEDGITQDELQKRMQNDPDFPKKYFVRANAEVPVIGPDGKEKVDAYGNPITHPTYSIITQATIDGKPDDKEVDAQRSADLKKYLGLNYPEGTKLTNPMDNALDVQMNSARHTTTILENTNGKELSSDQMNALRPYLTDTDIQHAVASKPGNAYAGIQEALGHADAHIAQAVQEENIAKQRNDQTALNAASANVTQLRANREKLVTFSNMAISPKQIEEYNKKTDDAMSMITDLQKKVNAASGVEAAGMAASVKDMLEKENTYTDQQKRMLTRIQQQAQTSADASLAYKLKEEKNKAEATNALVEGDVDVLSDAALNYQLDPNKLYSMRKDTNAKFKAEMLRRDPTWSEPVYKQRYNMQQELASDKPTSLGGQIESLNRFAYHVGEANRSIEGLRNIGSPIVNTALNKIKSGTVGFEEAQGFKVKMETAKDEFMNFIKAGHAPLLPEMEKLASLVNENRTPAEIQTAFRSMAELVAARGKAMNGRYNTIMGGGNIPGLLQPDTQSILRQFGIDVDAVTTPTKATSFGGPISGQQTPPAQFQGKIGVQAGGKTHYFNTQAEADNFKKLAGIQ